MQVNTCRGRGKGLTVLGVCVIVAGLCLQPCKAVCPLARHEGSHLWTIHVKVIMASAVQFAAKGFA